MRSIPCQILLVVALCSANLFAQQPQAGSLVGKVIDQKTRDPLPSVNVLIKGTTTGASSGVDGGFEIRNLSPGTYGVTFSSVGHIQKEIPNVVVTAGDVTRLEVFLEDRAVQMGDVTVYGASKRGEKITDAPAAVSVLDPEEIRLNGIGGQVPKLLETQGGVDIVQSGINDYNVNTRGFNSSLNRRLLVLLDGRDLAVAFLGSQEWNGLSVPVEDLGRMELIRGPGSALYGANAFNGVVNILTPAPAEVKGGKITLAGGELNTLRTDIRYASLSGPWSYKLNAGHYQSDTWTVSRLTFPFEYEGFVERLNKEVAPVDPGKVASTYGSARVDYQLENGGTTTLEGGATQVENEVLVTGIGRVQVPRALKPWGRISYTSDSWYVQAWGAGRNSLTPQVSLSTGLPLEEKSLIGQLDLQYRFSLMENRLFTVVGGAHRYQQVNTDGTLTLDPHYDNTSSLYTQLEYRASEILKAVAAVRWDRSTLHESQVSPKLALVWTPSSTHTIRATFNQAFQAPNYSELFLHVLHPVSRLAYFGNENLVVEHITGYEVGYKGVFGDAVYLTVDAYFNQLSDFITDLAPGVNPQYPGQLVLPGEDSPRTIWSYGNAGRVDEAGFEVAVNYYLTSNIELNANYAFFDFSIKEQNANDVLLPNAPDQKFNVGVTYRQAGLATQVNVKYVPSYDWAAGIYKGRILAYTLVNVNVSYDLTDYLTLAGTVTNLLDREHYQIFGGSLIGRRAIASVTTRF